MKSKKPPKSSLSNPNPKSNPNPLSVTKKKTKTKSKQKKDNRPDIVIEQHDDNADKPILSSEQLGFFFGRYQSATGIKLSSLELESIPENCILELSQCTDQNSETLGEDIKKAFGSSWKEVLCGKRLSEGKVDPGNPAILLISGSALRAIELLRCVRSLTKECHPVKLFSKHMKVEEQVSLLKNRVNIASGTPSRIKKLIDIEALGMSRLEIIVLDVRSDVKGYSLLTLPQVSDEFWDLYKNCFHERVVEGSLRIALYGPISNGTQFKGKKMKKKP